MHPVIRIIDLWKQYNNDEQDSIALRGANLLVMPGDIIALFGKSGSGKTTLLNLIAGLDKPTRGLIEIEGKNIETLNENGRTELRRNRIGFIFQFFNLLPTLTAFENVLFSLELVGKPDKNAVFEALHAVNLQNKEHRYPHELSGGEQQRVAVARAIVKKPAIILADEPTGNLDTHTGTQILELLVSQCHTLNTTLVMVSHAINTCHFANRFMKMTDGVLVEKASYEGIDF
ncbi:MAG TPA: ABC transporter ATP-binding protein [Syntrophorhabdaceae bacterium]|nr:ABC transporter ATP-binding protein [Syntrophorhabdaceae bacterium]MDI9560505.1 ABC transporter ATP-binding protein [Pseudomonadota bacterium]MBV6506156.1 putative ABC transporter ATP-binding protein [Syntrophorhabdaceae bacterium]HNZ58893.1 ABC transporter ATP-binding protein [Syntrophorhabdaceae bacterium]HOB69139.1 ABC transporter ATP-binding protein [Syntrophorhabdaceae bacterium]